MWPMTTLKIARVALQTKRLDTPRLCEPVRDSLKKTLIITWNILFNQSINQINESMCHATALAVTAFPSLFDHLL